MYWSWKVEDLTYRTSKKKQRYIGLATKWLRILSLGGTDKIRNHLVANPIETSIPHLVN